jgi:hypothetical protein
LAENKQQKPASLEAIVEEKIQEAYAAGEFEHLLGYGAPLPNLDEPLDEDWWIKEKLKREKISILPPSIEILRDVEKTLKRVATLQTERAVRAELAALNERIREANYRSVWGPPSTQMPVPIDELVAQWHARQNKPR